MMMTRIILYGAGYPDTVKTIERLKAGGADLHIEGFLDDSQTGEVMGYPILGRQEYLSSADLKDILFVNNVFGSVASRKKVAEVLDTHQCGLFSLISPDVDMQYVEYGKGICISPGVHMGARVKLGSHVAARMGSVVNHDNEIGDFVFIGPGVTLCGHVKVEREAYLGAGCVILPRLKIGERAFVGAGAVVTAHVAPGTTVAGVPAKVIK